MQSAVWLNQNGEEHTKIRFWAACVVACRSAISKICTLMQARSTSYLNDGITSPCSLKEWDKLEAAIKGVVNDVIKLQNSVFHEINIGTRILLKCSCASVSHDKHRKMVHLTELLLRARTSLNRAHPESIRLPQNVYPVSSSNVIGLSYTIGGISNLTNAKFAVI